MLCLWDRASQYGHRTCRKVADGFQDPSMKKAVMSLDLEPDPSNIPTTFYPLLDGGKGKIHPIFMISQNHWNQKKVNVLRLIPNGKHTTVLMLIPCKPKTSMMELYWWQKHTPTKPVVVWWNPPGPVHVYWAIHTDKHQRCWGEYSSPHQQLFNSLTVFVKSLTHQPIISPTGSPDAGHIQGPLTPFLLVASHVTGDTDKRLRKEMT